MGNIKRAPEIDRDVRGRFARMSKAEWAEAYCDLYRQVFGEEKTDAEIFTDAEHRAGILRAYRIASNMQACGL